MRSPRTWLGVGAVFVPAPWEVGGDGVEGGVDPLEELLVFRTVAHVLGGAKPVGRVTLDGRIECLVFDQGGVATLCVWDVRAPEEGVAYRLDLGEHVYQVDLWGRRRALPTVGGRQVVRIGPVPSFLLYARTWLMKFRRTFVVRPRQVEARFDPRSVQVEFRNTHTIPISGTVRFALPQGWEVRPSRAVFALEPGGVFRQRLEMHFPPNAGCGLLPLVGAFEIDADRHYRFTASTWFDFGPAGVDLDAIATRSDGRVAVRVSLANHTGRPVHFEGYLLAPGRPRLAKQFSRCQPGQRLTRTFVLTEAQDLAGRELRINLKEINGPRFWNRVVTVP